MISLTFTAEPADFASDDAVSEFFGAISAAFRAARKSLKAGVSAVAASAASATFAAPQPEPVAAQPAAPLQEHAAEHAAEHVEPAAEAPKPRKPRTPRTAPAAEAVTAPEPAPAVAVAAAPEADAPAAEMTFEAFRSAVNAHLAKGAAVLVSDAMRACGATKFNSVAGHHRAPFVEFLTSGGKLDLPAALAAADDAVSF